jgi:hypothetical protein
MSAFLGPRRLRVGGLILVVIAAIATALGGGSAAKSADSEPLCVQHPQMCTELNNTWTYEGQTYNSGHDEPSLLFYSNKPGSGNSDQYNLTLPSDPPTAPAEDGSGGTWNFQLRPAFWFGMAMCDDQAAPNPGAPCKADSDSNLHLSLNPSSPHYIGLTPGTAFMEMQFYPPGWGPISCTDSSGNQDGKWCSALTIDSVQSNSNTGVGNNAACNDLVGPEPVNYAIVTKSGHSEAPANPATPFSEQAVVTPDTLQYNNGDQLVVNMHDSANGFVVVITDLTTGESGSMTASIANGFGHALFQPDASTCTMAPYAFHPIYSTSTPGTRVLWAAHSYNVAYSDEIGHFEYCSSIDSNFNCTDSGSDVDDFGCFPAPVVDSTGATVVDSFIGCTAGDQDFNGPSYQTGNWPGTPGADPSKVTTPVQFTSPLFRGPGGRGLSNYSRIAFEADLPRIEGTDFSTNNDCQRHVSNPADPNPGQGCINPPNGASFYPMYITNTNSSGQCVWQEAGPDMPGATHTFGGSSTTEDGPLLLSNYPAAGFTITQRYNNFHRTIFGNPCPVSK